ncbi:MAG: N-acetyltransferase family protein [Chloroflexota bacterium]
MSTPDLLIRPAVSGDVPALTEIYNHYIRTSPATFDIEPVTVEARQEWASHYGTDGLYRLLVAERDGAVIGYATSSQFHERKAYQTSVQFSVYVHHQAHGHGVGSRLYTRLFEIMETMPVHRVYAGITLPNPGSLALHKKFGFEDIGTQDEVGHKFGRYWSVIWLEKRMSYA